MITWQEPAAFALVLGAVVFLIRSQLRAYRRRRQRACGSDCNCAAPDGTAETK